MTPIEAAIVTAYTTFLCGSFENFHKYAEEKLSRKIYTHEFVGANVWIELEKLSKGDFMNLKVDDVCEWSRESCEICDPALINPLIDEDGLYLFIDKDRIMTGYSDDCTFEKSESVKINYCPMCGREIEVEENSQKPTNTRLELAVLNKNKYDYYDKDTKETALLLTKIAIKRSELKKDADKRKD